MDADKPYVLDTGAGRSSSCRCTGALDDWEQYAYLPRPAVPVGDRVAVEGARPLDLASSTRCGRYGCLFVLTCHPFLSGRPHRVEVLRRVIEHALEAGDVEFSYVPRRGAEGAGRTRRPSAAC